MKRPPDVEFSAAMAVADRAMQRVLGDRAIWAEEQQRVDAIPLSWPPRIVMAEGVEGNHAGLMATLALTAVECVLMAMIEADTGEAPPDDPRWRARLRNSVQQLDAADPDVQVTLRVVERAIVAASAVLVQEFGGSRGAHRLSGKREFANWIKAREVDAAVRCGIPRAEALATLGFSRAAAYRAMKRR